MKNPALLRAALAILFAGSVPLALTAQTALQPAHIPSIGWERGIGVPPSNPGKPKVEANPLVNDGYYNGAPVGGFGAGTIGRGYRGDFYRYHLKIGANKFGAIASNQFAIFTKTADGKRYAQALFAGNPKQLKAWNWNYPKGGGIYHALYPKSWFRYKNPKLPIVATVEQFSPILPNNYRATSYPVALYNWTLHNPGNKPVTVGVLFSWTNMVGWFRDFSARLDDHSMDDYNRVQSQMLPGGKMIGIVFDRRRTGPVRQDWDGQYAIATLQQPGVQVTTHSTYSAGGDGRAIWDTFSRTGTLTQEPASQDWTSSGGQIAGALAITVELQPGQTRVVPMVLSWDLPLAQFGHGARWYREYTRYFGRGGTNAWAIARAGLLHDAAWSAAIDRWQQPYIADSSTPAWYRGMLFNEMYYLADGGTLWTDGQYHRAPYANPALDKFSYMECFDYPYYDTLDVRFYGSMPLIKWWPRLDKSAIRAFADSVPQNLSTIRRIGWNHKLATRKNPGALPHDLGSPEEAPLVQFNNYNWQDVNIWKDLNTKYVLQVWRDYALTGRTDRAFLRYNWRSVVMAMNYLKRFDRLHDGLLQNDGVPDQTYDVWPMRGDSAYCDSLWLAALRASEEMARTLGYPAQAQAYHAAFLKGQKTFVAKLWNGSYFEFDTGSPYRNNVMADQLCGQWYADLTGLGYLVPKADVDKALRTIYRLNVMDFNNGQMGAINGIDPSGQLLFSNEQIHEVWTGVTLGLASFMRAEGMEKQAFQTAYGIYNVVYHRGYWFRTPEAWDEHGDYRAELYMRPGAIWAMEMTKPAAQPPARGK